MPTHWPLHWDLGCGGWWGWCVCVCRSVCVCVSGKSDTRRVSVSVCWGEVGGWLFSRVRVCLRAYVRARVGTLMRMCGVSVCVCAWVRPWVWVPDCRDICVYACLHVYMCVCVCMSILLCVCVCVCVCKCLCWGLCPYPWPDPQFMACWGRVLSSELAL